MSETIQNAPVLVQEIEGFSVLDMASAPEPTPEERREAAFHASYNWRGKTFEGLSLGKKMQWHALCRYLGYPSLDECFRDPEGFIPMAHCLIFMCVADWREIKRIRGAGMAALADAYETWLEANSTIAEEQAVVSLAAKIINDSVINKAEVIASAGEGKPLERLS